jgi:2,4-dienoyl-CoA reductase-like NADH-dependent reductase (Old Yellow Enzyme family)
MGLFSTFILRELKFRNRIFVSPMCQYSSNNGAPNEWHHVHLGCRAVGGAGLVMTEATSVSAEGRISPSDAGIWNDEQARGYRPITEFIAQNGAVPGIQLAHAGRKASTAEPWNGGGPLAAKDGGWTTLAPSPLPFTDGFSTPREMTQSDIETVVRQFAEAAKRSLAAGFQVVELHMAHGYLMHQFLSPLTNKRTDDFGGALENRVRLPTKVAEEVRKIWPAKWPVFVRISFTDWVDGGWDGVQSVFLSKALKKIGIDLIDCSSGGIVHGVKFKKGPGFQVPFAETIRKEAQIATGAVGFITDPQQAEEIISGGKADAVFLARQMLRDPYWPLHAAKALGADVPWPKQYERAK